MSYHNLQEFATTLSYGIPRIPPLCSYDRCVFVIVFAKTRFTVTNRLFRVEHETASRASRERKTITYTGVQSSDYVLCTVCDSIVVSIPRCHRGDRGSIPRRAVFAFFCMRSPRRHGGDARGSDAPLFISKLAPVAEIRRFPCAAVWVRFLPAETFWRK